MTTTIGGFITPALAFDPMEGSEQPTIAQQTIHYQTYTPTDGSRYARGQGLPASVVPQRYYAAPAQIARGAAAAYSPTINPPTTAIAPAYNQVATAAPAYIPPANSKTAAQVFVPAGQEAMYNAAPYNPAPVYTPPAPAPMAAPAPMVAQAAMTPPPVQPQPVYDAYVPPAEITPVADGQYETMTPVANSKRNRYYVGIEGFYDRYQEESLNLDSRSVYGAVDAGFNHYFNPDWFAGSEFRTSYGKENYKSPSGKIDGVDQWEFESRITGGYDFAMTGNRHFKTISGLDTRYYRDEGKGEVTNLGAAAYDRRILQVFIPLGISYEFPAWGYHFAPSMEYDHLIYGRVESRLQNVPGYDQATNYQKSGYGLRAEFLASKIDSRGYGWEFGPFVRYWHFNNSDIDTTAPTPSGNLWMEPDNNRLQVGAKLKFLF